MKLLQIKTLLYIHVKTNTIEFIDFNMHAASQLITHTDSCLTGDHTDQQYH